MLDFSAGATRVKNLQFPTIGNEGCVERFDAIVIGAGAAECFVQRRRASGLPRAAAG
jgi:hypothetical protein